MYIYISRFRYASTNTTIIIIIIIILLIATFGKQLEGTNSCGKG